MRILAALTKTVTTVTQAVSTFLEPERLPRRHPDDEAWYNDNVRRAEVNARRHRAGSWLGDRPRGWLTRPR
jgi:hypothetical protein